MNQKTIHFNAEMDQDRVLERLHTDAVLDELFQKRERAAQRGERQEGRYNIRDQRFGSAAIKRQRRAERRFAGGRHEILG